MLFLERYAKKLNGFVQKSTKQEGYKANGYMVYESFYYANEYIRKIGNTIGVVVWDDQQDEDKRQGELLQTNGKRYMIKSKSLISHQICIEQLFILNLII